MADPDLQIRGGGGAVSKNIFFGPPGLILGEKLGGAPPPGPSPGSATDFFLRKRNIWYMHTTHI